MLLNKINSRPYNAWLLAFVKEKVLFPQGQSGIVQASMKQLFRKKSPDVVVVETQKPLPSLLACLLFDFIGYASFGVPILGEFLDIVWAPVSALIFWKMFGFRKGFLGGAFSFFEELMPGLDFIPTFTINWFLLYFKRNKGTLSIRPVAR